MFTLRSAFGAVLLSCGLVLAGCGSGGSDNGSESVDLPSTWSVVTHANTVSAVKLAATDVAGYFKTMGFIVNESQVEKVPACVSGAGRIVFVGDGLGTADLSGDTNMQTWRIKETRCGKNGIVVELMGGGLLGRQYAAYDFLHRIGLRFFHPEQEYVPDKPDWPLAPMDIQHTPPFRLRSVSLHLSHPLELGDVFHDAKTEYMPEAKRYIDWTVKNYASDGQGGAGSGEYANYGMNRGFATSAGITLYNQEQGGDGILQVNDSDEASWQPKLETAIKAQMGSDPKNYPEFFSFTFDPTEFTQADDRLVVAQMTYIGNYFKDHYPNTTILTINQGTHEAPTPYYKARYFDLPKYAPDNIGVKIHPLMFYDLFRPAPVYGNENYHELYDFMASEYTKRPLVYFPESAWWLTFDIAVPLYLPITIEARGRDLQGIKYMLAGKLMGHHTFGTGHEWGYWQNEYCSLRMAADLDMTWRDCLADITYPMASAAAEVQSTLESAIAIEERDIIYGDILRYLVGSDPETEAAASVGIVFHPLPPSPAEVASWDETTCNDFEYRVTPQLQRFDDDMTALVKRLDAVESQVPAKAKPFFNEIRDGFHANALRARHQRLAYGSLVSERLSKLSFSSDKATQATDRLAAAKGVTEEERALVAQREAGYRYQPISRAIGGGDTGTEDTNWTVYKYRYLNRTHTVYYFTRIDKLVEDALTGGGQSVEIHDALLGPKDDLSLTITDTSLTSIGIDLGDGSHSAETTVTHHYANAGVYTVSVTATKGSDSFNYVGKIAQLTDKRQTGFSADIIKPDGVTIIEPVFPALVVGHITPAEMALGFSAVKGTNRVTPDYWTTLQAASSTNYFQSVPQDLNVPIVDKSKGTVTAVLQVANAVITWPTENDKFTLTGDLSTDAIVQAVVKVGGFDEKGAKDMVASYLGFTTDQLPATVPMEVNYTPEASAR